MSIFGKDKEELSEFERTLEKSKFNENDVEIEMAPVLQELLYNKQKKLDEYREKATKLQEEIESYSEAALNEGKKFWLTVTNYLGLHPLTPITINEENTLLSYSTKTVEEFKDLEIPEHVKDVMKEMAVEGTEFEHVAAAVDDIKVVSFEKMLNKTVH